jgi:hypothetical protein
MTVDDEKLIERMFDEATETHVELVDGKYVAFTDKETIAQMDASAMAEALNDFGFWAKKFRDSNGGDAHHGRANTWWVNLQWLALADAKLKDLFCGRDRSPESIKRYHTFRLQLIEGGSSKADA